jgi:hypothetical protein
LKGNGMKRILIILVLFLMGAVPCVRAQKSPPAPEAKVRGWKTYRNLKFGFEFQYPKKYFVADYSVGPDAHQFLSDQPISGTQPPLLDLVEVQTEKGQRALSIEVPDQKKFTVVERSYDWSLRACGEIGFEDITSKQETVFAGYPTLKVANTSLQFYCVHSPQPIIIFYDTDSDPIPARIVSTFKFFR